MRPYVGARAGGGEDLKPCYAMTHMCRILDLLSRLLPIADVPCFAFCFTIMNLMWTLHVLLIQIRTTIQFCSNHSPETIYSSMMNPEHPIQYHDTGYSINPRSWICINITHPRKDKTCHSDWRPLHGRYMAVTWP